MWRTSTGNRTLCGAEAALVRAAIDVMIDDLEFQLESCDETAAWQFGIAVFDHLSAGQRLAVLHAIARHLLTPTEDTLPLSATTEATVGAVFEEIRDQVVMEIETSEPDQPQLYLGGPEADCPDECGLWRHRVLAAYDQVRACCPELPDGDDGVPGSVDDVELRRWETVIERLADAILWDRDYEMAECFLDAAPDAARHRRSLLGIDDDYYTSIAPDPRPCEIPDLITATRALTRARPR